MSDNQESTPPKTDDDNNSEIPIVCDNIIDNSSNNNDNNNDGDKTSGKMKSEMVQSYDNKEALSLSPPCSEISVASSTTTTKIPKPSGHIGGRPPSRIGRPCGGIQKPAIPTTPTQKTNSSAILTEDTDSFIIGQRIWVGGTKPGTIAYIGETQFAPGEWAGIALDEPIGKNDGSVGGIHYFQCEPKKGIFSRLTRLTRVPLDQPMGGSNETFQYSTPSPTNGIRRSPVSPTGSTRGSIKSPISLSTSNTSLTLGGHVDFKVGDRVIIKSSQGSKVGTVRYMGLTEFAPGEWVGVELDDPRGKNDGSVEGKRYFECRPNFGLFAPIAKVSKSPSKYKPGACALHGGLLKRVNSKESLTSSLTSKTSLASSNIRRVRLGVTSLTPKKPPIKTTTPLTTRPSLQDVLRDKQQQIDQLLRERDLERAQITKAAGQADEAEQKLFQLQQEYENYRSECDLKLRQQIELLAQLRTNETDILSQLDDEKRKNEDLLFRFEEAAITKGDIEVSNETNIKRIKELERQLDEERKKAENLELLSNKLFETEENLFKTREELEEIRNGQQHSSSKELIDNLEKQLETIVNQNVEQEEKLKKINGEFQQILNERNSLQIELDGINKNNKEEIDELKLQLNEKLAIINKYEDDKMAILKENDRLVVELNRKTNDLDSANNQLSIKAEELVIVKDELKRKIDEIDHYVDKCRTNDEELIRKDDQLKENEFKIGKYLEEITKLTNELDEIRLKHSEITNEIEIRHKRQTDDIELKFDNLHKELQMKINETNSLTIVISKLEDDLCKKNGIIEKLNLELESMKRQLIVSDENFQGVFNQLQEIKLEKSQLELDFNQLKHDQHELLVEKTKLQQQLQIEYEKCQDSAQLDELRRQLDEHDKNSMVIRQEFVEKLQNSDRQRQQIELELNQRVQQYERIQMELEEKLNVALKSEQLLKEHCENALIERRTLTDENLAKLQQFEQQLLVKEQELNRIVGKSSEQERLLEALNQQKQNNNEQIRNLNEEIVKLKDELVKKSEDLIGIESKLNLILAENQQNLLNEQQQFNQKIQQLELIQEEKETKLKEIQNEMDLLKMDCQNKNVDVVEKDHKISELFVELQSRQNLINQLQQQLNNHEMINDETMKKYEQHQQYCDDLQQQLVILNEKLQINQELIVNLQLERKNLIDLLKKLRISDLDKKNLLQEIENSDGNQQCSYILELLKNLQVDNFDEIQMKIIELEELLDLTRKQLNDRNEECELKKVEVLRLQQELAREMNGTTTTTTGQIEDQNTLIQDKEMADNQIKFLNSIIADIQMKNEQQRARIELLESASNLTMEHTNILQKRQVAPRMYCDICEEFDLHETEDCPQQNSDMAANFGGEPRVPRQSNERPYCEICEAFGHSTQECPDDGTY